MFEWSHLPNASHIDRVLASAKQYPEIWVAARAASYNASYCAARDAAWAAAPAAAAARPAPHTAAYGAVLALIAYDDSAKYLEVKYLEMTLGQLQMWSILSEEPAAILLLPAAIAFANIEELTLETTG